MKLKSIARETAAGILLVTIGLLLFVLLYGIGLTVFDIPAANAEVVHYPLAYVEVNAESCLNVRSEPMGTRLFGLPCWTDVVILDQADGWAYVSTPDRIAERKPPCGWVSMDYLNVYGDYMANEKSL